VGLKPILRTTTSLSALTLSVGSFDPQKPVPDMTSNVFSGTLNPTQSILTFEVDLRRDGHDEPASEIYLGQRSLSSEAIVRTRRRIHTPDRSLDLDP